MAVCGYLRVFVGVYAGEEEERVQSILFHPLNAAPTPTIPLMAVSTLFMHMHLDFFDWLSFWYRCLSWHLVWKRGSGWGCNRSRFAARGSFQ
jgi:hypothetical protein